MVRREQLVRVAKRRGFFFQTAAKHGGASGLYTLGPHGEAMRQRLADSWRSSFVTAHGFDEIQSPTILPESVFEASGHLDSFDDAMIQCQSCGSAHRADHLVEEKEDIEDAEGRSAEALAQVLATIDCPTCGNTFDDPSVTPFNLMFDTQIGPQNGSKGYLRPETAQGTLAEVWQLKEYAREQTPFGMAQVGRAYRNEISPRKSLLRTREFTQAELQTFVFDERPPFERLDVDTVTIYPVNEEPSEQAVPELEDRMHSWLAYYLALTAQWLQKVGIPKEKIRFRQHTTDELAHYADNCWDAEAEIHGEWVEIAGLANRGSHDLEAHAAATDGEYTVFRRFDSPREVERVSVEVDMGVLGPKYKQEASDIEDALVEKVTNDPTVAQQGSVSVTIADREVSVSTNHIDVSVEAVEKDGEHRYPTVIEPAFGLERVLYAVLATTYEEDTVDGEVRRRFALPSNVAPTTVMVTPAVTNNKDLSQEARSLRDALREADIKTAYEDTGGIGRRYRRHDEIGTPLALTVDHQTMEDGTVTLRNRDTRQQVRIDKDGAVQMVERLRDEALSFRGVVERYPVVDPSS